MDVDVLARFRIAAAVALFAVVTGVLFELLACFLISATHYITEISYYLGGRWDGIVGIWE